MAILLNLVKSCEGKDPQDDRSASYAVRDGDSTNVKKLEVTEMKMCRWACGHTLRDHDRQTDRQTGNFIKIVQSMMFCNYNVTQ